MAKPFSEEEKREIRSRILRVAEYRFSRYGYKKTSLDEIARDTGIAKGSLYNFFSSKDELLFELLRKEEKKKWQLIELSSNEDPYQMMERIIDYIDNHQLSRSLYAHGDFSALQHRLPDTYRRENDQGDKAFAKALLQHCNISLQDETSCEAQALELSAQLRILFFISLHREEIGEGYRTAILRIGSFIAAYLERLGQEGW